jgi:hypothetical protein
MDDSRIKSARELLEAFFDEEKLRRGRGYAEFFSSWKFLVGEQAAAHSRVADVNNGILVIETEHPGWIQLLQLRQKAILDGIEARYPELNLRSIVFRVGSATTEQSKPLKPTPQATVLLTEEDRAIVREADTTGVEDPLLRTLLASLKATMENGS